jgi:hypothetical protein
LALQIASAGGSAKEKVMGNAEKECGGGFSRWIGKSCTIQLIGWPGRVTGIVSDQFSEMSFLACSELLVPGTGRNLKDMLTDAALDL